MSWSTGSARVCWAGGGKSPFAPGVRLNLELVEQRRFGNGVVLLQYRPK
jgi:hypothetical protein